MRGRTVRAGLHVYIYMQACPCTCDTHSLPSTQLSQPWLAAGGAGVLMPGPRRTARGSLPGESGMALPTKLSLYLLEGWGQEQTP